MRVLIVSHHAPPHIGGLESMVGLEVRALARRGHEVVLVTSNPGGPIARSDDPPGVEVIRVGAWHVVERRFNVTYPLFSPRLAWVLWRQLGRCDAVHAHGCVFMSTAMAMPLAALRRKRRILTDHGGVLRYPSGLLTFGLRVLIETIGRINCLLATRLVALNADVRRLLRRLGGRADKVIFLPNPVDRERFHPPTPDERAAARRGLGWADDRPKVLFVGRLVPDKGVDILLQAKDPSFDLVFCGPGEPGVIARLQAQGAQHLPPRPQRDLVPVYHAADAFALPSWNEGFPAAIQEALACGLPVVTTQTDAYEPYRGLAGLHLSPIDPPTFRRAILDVLSNRGAAAPNRASNQSDDLLPTVDRWLTLLFGLSPVAADAVADGGEPVLSVIIPVYNAETTVDRALRSLERITPLHRRRTEVLVVNDGSTDASAAVIGAWSAGSSFRRFELFDKPNGGSASARNMGLRAARGRWVFMLDADDELRTDPVERVERHPHATAIMFAAQVVRHDRPIGTRRPPRVSAANHLDVFTAGNPLPPSTVLFRKDAVDRPMDESLRAGEDWLFWLRNPRVFATPIREAGVVGAAMHLHGANKSADYAMRGRYRSVIAERFLTESRGALTRKQANNLRLQWQIGQIQEGGRLRWSSFLRLPCSLSLYLKFLAHATLRGGLRRFDPYQRS